ncbi:MAG: arylsulfatase [Planctomycetes bacterium]|nr:arylsulfatase [Planctomycetota bacterium]
MRGDAMSCDGNGFIDTPNLDSLAARGTRFRYAYTAVPSCLPARAILWTGMSQWHTGVLGMGRGQGPIPNDFPHTLAGELTAAGYQTHRVGKGHFAPQTAPMGFETFDLDESGRQETPGFIDDYRAWFAAEAGRDITPDDHGVDWNSWVARPWHTEEYLHPTAWTMSRAIKWLAGRDRTRPFFLNISFARPHSPYVPPQAYWDRYINAETPAPAVGDWAAVHDDPRTADDTNAWRGRKTAEQIHRARAGYYGEITFIDAQIGRLMNWLTRYQRDAIPNTWFVFTSDHGDMQGDHHLWRKTYAYEGSARIPLLIAPPRSAGRPARAVADEAVELRDIMPTILAMAGAAAPPTVEGRDMLPLMTAPAADWRPYIHGEHCWCYSAEQEMQYVTDGKHKFIWLPRLGVEQFFDLTADPGELHNLIDDGARADDAALWRRRLIDELAARDCGWTDGDRLTCPDGPLVSPWKDVRWQGEGG